MMRLRLSHRQHRISTDPDLKVMMVFTVVVVPQPSSGFKNLNFSLWCAALLATTKLCEMKGLTYIRSLVRPLAKREYEGRASFLENRFLPLFHTKT
jgi:hypothetical protein